MLDQSKVLDMSIAPDTFRSQISEAKKRLQQLLGEQRKVTEEIEYLRELIRANANFLPDDERAREIYFLEIFRYPTNITEAVRLALSVAASIDEKVAPVEIKGIIERVGFDFSEYSNPMASIHTILKRMREADPPQVNYDEEKGAYWLDSLLEDSISPEVLKGVFDKTIDEIMSSASRDKIIATAQKVTSETLRKVNAMAKRAKED
jgi:hypothetical protein